MRYHMLYHNIISYAIYLAMSCMIWHAISVFDIEMRHRLRYRMWWRIFWCCVACDIISNVVCDIACDICVRYRSATSYTITYAIMFAITYAINYTIMFAISYTIKYVISLYDILRQHCTRYRMLYLRHDFTVQVVACACTTEMLRNHAAWQIMQNDITQNGRAESLANMCIIVCNLLFKM